MDLLFKTIYPFVGLMSFTAFLPQIMALIQATAAPKSFSISSWFVWLATAGMTFGYAFFTLRDPAFSCIAGLSFLMNAVVIALAVYNKHYRFISRCTQTAGVIDAISAHDGSHPGHGRVP